MSKSPRTFDTYKEPTDFEKDVLAQVVKPEYVKPSNKRSTKWPTIGIKKRLRPVRTGALH
jgi:hypothetical protein